MERVRSSRSSFGIAAAVAAAFTLSACGRIGSGGGDSNSNGGGTVDTVRPKDGPKVTVIAGAPLNAAAIDRAIVDLPSAPQRLAVAHGVLAVGTATGLFVSDAVSSSKLTALSVRAASGEPDATGIVRWISQRQNGGVLVAAENGLFHDLDGELLLSPLTQSLSARAASVDALGDSTSEELWLVPDDAATNARVLQVAGGELWTVRLSNVTGAPEAAVALAPGLGLVAAGGAAYEVDLNAHTAKLVAEELGAAHGFARAGDGTAYLATDMGLLVRGVDGTISRRTFAEEGAQPIAARAVAVDADGAALVVTDDGVLQLSQGTTVRIAARSAGAAQVSQVARDANGDTWTVDDGALVKLATGATVSFASDVKPFFAAHCMSCHAGKGPGPAIALEDLEAVKAKSAVIVKRLEADGAPPMPPQSTEVLAPSDYAVVLRWVAGGMKP